MKLFVNLFSLVSVLALTVVSGAFGEEVRVGGGGAAISGVFNPVKPHFEKATGITLMILQSSPKDGLVDLAKGKVDVATAAVGLEGMIAGAEKDGVKIDPASLVRQEISTNRTAIFVHPSNKVTNLSKEQLKGIFTGKILNWKDVGGDDKDIIVVWGKATPGQNAQFIKEILDGEALTKDILDTTNYAKIKETVASTPEGVGIDPFGLADESVKVVETPRLVSPIIAITMGPPSAKIQKLLDYIKGTGNVYLKK